MDTFSLFSVPCLFYYPFAWEGTMLFRTYIFIAFGRAPISSEKLTFKKYWKYFALLHAESSQFSLCRNVYNEITDLVNNFVDVNMHTTILSW